jgi:hypothetical protein
MPQKKDEKPEPKSRKGRKTWVRPEIRTGKLFEVNSLACGKNSSSTSQCRKNVQSS